VYKRIAAVAGVILITSCLCLTACYGVIRGSGNITTRYFEYTDFHAVEVDYAFHAEIVRGSSFSISITADENLFDSIRINVADETLKIGMKPGFSYFPSALVARIVMPDINSVSAYGASSIEISGFQFEHNLRLYSFGASEIELKSLKVGDASLHAGTASNIIGNLEGIDLAFEASGASRLSLSGSGRNISLTASGASNIDLAQLVAQDAVVGLSSASSAIIHLTGRLDAGLSGASHLQYGGDPVLGNINLSDFSTVSKE
jgi:hypothetical protein